MKHLCVKFRTIVLTQVVKAAVRTVSLWVNLYYMLLRAAAAAEAYMISENPNNELADSNPFTCISAIFSIPAVLVGRDLAWFCSKLSKLSRSQCVCGR